MLNIRNKVVVITGAAQGIGLALAERFTQEGAQVVLSDVNDTAGETAAKRLQAHYQHCDVGDAAQVAQLFANTVNQYGRVDAAVANAGIARHDDPLALTEEDFDAVLRVNLKGVFLTGQAAARQMVQQTPDADGQRGSIINMSSINAVVAIADIAPYVVAKGGVTQWTKCLALRLAAEGVRVNAIGPGSINTEMFRGINNTPEKMRNVLQRTPMLRAGEPDEIAKIAVFLASNYSTYMTGETLYADGGRLALNYCVPVPVEKGEV